MALVGEAALLHDVRDSKTSREPLTGEGRTFGFCKLVVDRPSCRMLGCHVVEERAVEIAQLAAVAMTAQMRVDELARAAISFPTYAEVLFYAVVRAMVELGLPLSGQLEHVGA